MKEGKSLFSISEIGGFLKGKTLLKDDGVCGTYESNGEIFVVQKLESYLTDFETETTKYSVYFSVLRGVSSVGSH